MCMNFSVICNKFVIYIADKLVKFIGQVEEHINQVIGMAKLKFVVRQFSEEVFWNRYRSHIGQTIQYKRPVIIFSGKTMMADVFVG